jgi:hypothetical protein
MSYWDVLPDEIQNYILELKQEIIIQERNEILNNTSTEDLINIIIKRYSHANESNHSHSNQSNHSHSNQSNQFKQINSDYFCKFTCINTRQIRNFIDFECTVDNGLKASLWKHLDDTSKNKKCEEILKSIESSNLNFDFEDDNFWTVSSYCFDKLVL